MLIVFAMALQAASTLPSVVGFSCSGYGEKKPSKWLNISVESAAWQSADDGEWHKVSHIAPTEIWLTSKDDYNFTIDRRSLVLTETMLVGPGKQLLSNQWACKIGAALDITAGRKF